MGKPKKYTVVKVSEEFGPWLWRERRRRDRSIAWIVEQALKQYRARIEKNLKSSRAENDD